jgi:hypothetical protein
MRVCVCVRIHIFTHLLASGRIDTIDVQAKD